MLWNKRTRTIGAPGVAGLFFFIALAAAPDAAAQEAGSDGAAAEAKADAGPLHNGPACRRTLADCRAKSFSVGTLGADQSVSVDGRLDDEIWQSATFIDDFMQKEPDEGAPPTVRTEVAFVHDGTTLYVGARMESEDASNIRAVMTRRDNDGNSDRLIISFDGFQDRNTSYTFAVTAAGVRMEWFGASDSEFDRDRSFNPVWTAASDINGQGWTAEMAIPLSQMRFSPGVDSWGVNVNRYIPEKNEDLFWVAVPKGESGWSSWFGDMNGMQGLNARRPIEIVPYFASNAAFTSSELFDPANPFEDGSDLQGRAGVDIKAGIGPNITLDAAINPDFGQVEADPAVVNLSAFPVFFSERRPFFIEGDRLLRGRGPGYYFSRRIGAPPSGSASGDFVDRPRNTTILGSAKLTGRLNSGLSIGFLGALTDEESATTFDASAAPGSQFGETRVEPRAGFGVLRLQQEFGAAASTAGIILTATERDVDESVVDPLGATLHKRAISGGADWNLRFKGGDYVLSGHLGGVRVEGDTAAIRRTQEFSAHYYQRPDQDHKTFDPTRTSLSGYSARMEIERASAEHWLWSASMAAESPGFAINDLGRLSSADDIDAFGYLRYQETEPGSLFHNWNVTGYFGAGWNFGWDRQYAFLDLEANMTYKSFWNTFFSFEYFPAAQSDNRTRGGPSMGSGSSWNADAFVGTDFRKKTRFTLFAGYNNDELGGWRYNFNFGVRLQPTESIELSLDPRFSRSVDTRQYVGEFSGGPVSTFGQRYVFGATDRSTLSMQFRLNYAITPDFSLEGYAEPFASTATFTDFGELEAARSKFLRFYGTDGTTIVETPGAPGDPNLVTVTDGADTFNFSRGDFNILSFRTNLVARWEWQPGSTLFLVWQLDRSDFAFDTDPGIAGLGDLGDSASSPGHSFFAVKVSYWLPF
ncbi:MAG: DUF5916 domain-containing protein [Gemmatimonadota bacterium]